MPQEIAGVEQRPFAAVLESWVRGRFPKETCYSTGEVRKLLQAAVGVQKKTPPTNPSAVTFSNLQFSREKGRR